MFKNVENGVWGKLNIIFFVSDTDIRHWCYAKVWNKIRRSSVSEFTRKYVPIYIDELNLM